MSTPSGPRGSGSTDPDLPGRETVSGPDRPNRAWAALVLAPSLVLVLLLTLVPVTTNDFWLQVAVGRIILETGHAPQTALFPFTPARDFPFFAHEWLPSVLFHLLNEKLGYGNLIYVKGALGLTLFGLVVLLVHRVQRHLLPAILLGVVTVAAVNQRHFLRPEIFSYILLLLELIAVAEYRTSGRIAWLLGLVPLTALWANTHGSFLLAPLVVLLFGLGAALGEGLRPGQATRSPKEPGRNRGWSWRWSWQQAQPFLLAGTLLLLATLINPYGFELLRFSWSFSRSEVSRSFFEWVPTFSPLFMSALPFKVFLVYLVILAAGLTLGRKQIGWSEVLLLLVFGYLAVSRQRHIALFVYVSAYVLARALRGRWGSERSQKRLALVSVPILLALCFLVRQYGNVYQAKRDSVTSWKLAPELVERVRSQNLEGNVFNSVALGAELVEKFYPSLRIVIDSRIDVYDEDYWNWYLRLFQDEVLLLGFLDQYHVRYFFLTVTDFESSFSRMPRLHADGWRQAYSDGRIVVLARISREGQ